MDFLWNDYLDLINVSPWRNIRVLATSLISMSISLLILGQETKKRFHKKAIFPLNARALSVFSYLCIVFGPISIISLPFGVIQDNSLCIISESCNVTAFIIQMLSMEYFQLSRLYYCFSRDRVYSAKGYPRSLFIIMFAAFTISGLVAIVSHIMFQVESHCGRNMDHLPSRHILSGSVVCLFLLDIFTAFLYWIKIRKLQGLRQSTDSKINRNIQTILYRVLLLTLFYLVITFISIYIVIRAFVGIESVAYSVSIYLMLDHNIEEYAHFLKGVKRLKLHWCCCCCGFIVTQQYESMKADLDQKQNVIADGNDPASIGE